MSTASPPTAYTAMDFKMDTLRFIALLFTLSTTAAQIATDFALRYDLMEAQQESQNYYIGDVKKDAKLSALQVRLSDLRFKLAESNPWLKIDRRTGRMTNKSPVDLEELCPSKLACPNGGVLKVQVRVSGPGGQAVALIPVEVNVQDINDHSPAFESSFSEIRVSEIQCQSVPSSCLKPEIELPKARDRDFSNKFSHVTYSLDRTSEDFALKMKVDTPYLQILKALDYEKKREFNFVLTATDVQNKKGSTKIKITVEDFNDNVPRFRKDTYETRVSETTPVHTIIYTLKAVDPDTEGGKPLVYRMKSSDISDFTVDTSGRVSTAASLDFENQQRYVIPVEVNDGMYSDVTKLIVMVTDANDNAPEWEKRSPLTLPENTPPAQLDVVRVLDKDSGSNGLVTCPYINNQNTGLEFRRRVGEPNTFDLLATRSFDREKEPRVTAYITCYDRGSPPKTATLTQVVQILDKNDNTPQFRYPVIHARVEENKEAGEPVSMVAASDADEGVNRKIKYRLAPGEQENFFKVYERSGRITTRQPFDRETRDFYSLVVLAVDEGNPPRTGSVRVNVTILDANDHRPRFVGDPKFSVLENRREPMVLGRLRAVDEDIGENGRLVFVQVSNSNKGKFLVLRNGTIVTRRAFDREMKDRYCIRVCVHDMGRVHTGETRCQLGDSVSETKTVCINILDENDNKPNITQPRNTSAIIHISIHTHPVGHAVVQVLAEDKDTGENGRIKYSLQYNQKNLFAIDPDSGLLTVARKLTLNDLNHYKVIVVATDSGSSPLNDVKVLHIAVNDMPLENGMTVESMAAAHTRRNIMIIIVLASVSAVLAIILIAAILCVNRPCCTPLFNGVHVPLRQPKYPMEPGDNGIGMDGQQMRNTNSEHSWPSTTLERFNQGSNLQSPLESPNSGLCESKPGLCVDKSSVGSGDSSRRANTTSFTTPRPGKSAKPGAKSEQVKFWLYQIREDGPASPSKICSKGGRCAVEGVDGTQSDSGRGCSDEDLAGHCSVNGGHPGAPQSHTLPRGVGNGACASCTGSAAMLHTFYNQPRYVTPPPIQAHTLPHPHHGEQPYDALHSNSYLQDSEESGARTPATLRKMRVPLGTPPPSGSVVTATIPQAPTPTNTNDIMDPDKLCQEIDSLFFKDMV